jgi:hypothetical protein
MPMTLGIANAKLLNLPTTESGPLNGCIPQPPGKGVGGSRGFLSKEGPRGLFRVTEVPVSYFRLLAGTARGVEVPAEWRTNGPVSVQVALYDPR